MQKFIEQSNSIHKDKFDYSKVEYVNTKTKVIIICKVHGKFEQLSDVHLSGCGCKKCGVIRRANLKRKQQQKFIEEAISIHKDKYDYSKVKYLEANTKVVIICKIHGEFQQTPSKHLNSQGCKKCSNKKNGDKQRKSQEKFIEQSNSIHKDKFDYSKVEYVNTHTNVIIICKLHNVTFHQSPSNHLRSEGGCKKCINKGFQNHKLNGLKKFHKREIFISNML